MFTILNGQIFGGPRGDFTQNGRLYFLRSRTIHFGLNDFHPQITEGLLLSNRYKCLSDYWLLWDEKNIWTPLVFVLRVSLCVKKWIDKIGQLLSPWVPPGQRHKFGDNIQLQSLQEHLCHSDATGSVWLVKKGLQVPRALLPHTWDLGLLLGRKVDGPATWLVGQEFRTEFPENLIGCWFMLILIITEKGNNRRLRFFDTTLIYSYHLSISFRFVHQNAIKKTCRGKRSNHWNPMQLQPNLQSVHQRKTLFPGLKLGHFGKKKKFTLLSSQINSMWLPNFPHFFPFRSL